MSSGSERKEKKANKRGQRQIRLFDVGGPSNVLRDMAYG